MGKNKGAPARRPVKAKGTIPAPRTGYRAARKPWYKHRQFQVVGGLIALVLIGFAVYQVMAWRDRVEKREADRKAVKAFNDKVGALTTEITGPLAEMTSKPEQFRNGQIKTEEYTEAAQKWLAVFQDMATELRSQNPPAGLENVRAHMVESAVIFINGVRTFQLAAQATDKAVRDQAILLGTRQQQHAQIMLTNAINEMQAEKKRVGLKVSETATTPQLPNEDDPPAPAPATPPAPNPAASP